MNPAGDRHQLEMAAERLRADFRLDGGGSRRKRLLHGVQVGVRARRRPKTCTSTASWRETRVGSCWFATQSAAVAGKV